MAEQDNVSRDQHRADMAELRGELKEDIAGLRQDMTAMRGELKEEIAGLRLDISVLAKSLEAQGQRMEQGFAEMCRELGQILYRAQNLVGGGLA